MSRRKEKSLAENSFDFPRKVKKVSPSISQKTAGEISISSAENKRQALLSLLYWTCCIFVRLAMLNNKMLKKRVLITGATGFIGGALVREAQAKGYEVCIAVRPETSKASVKELKEQGQQLLVLDYANGEELYETLRKEEVQRGIAFDYVVHNAGATKALNPKSLYKANAQTSQNLIQAFERLEHKPKRFVLMSSLSAYGVDESGIISRQTPQTPKSHYGKSKLQAERALNASSLNYTILQPTGVYGIGDKDYLIQINSVLNGFNVLSGLSKQSLSYVYVDDLAKAAFFLLDKEEANKQSFIISDGRHYDDNFFGKVIRNYAKENKTIKASPFCLNLRFPLFLLWFICQVSDLFARISGKTQTLNKDKYHIISQRSWLCDASPLFRLGFTPEYDLSKGLARTLEHICPPNCKE